MFKFLLAKRRKAIVDIELLFKQVKENNKRAQYALGLAYYRGTGVEKNVEKANYWIEKASEKYD